MAPGDSVGIGGLLGMGPHCPGAGALRGVGESGDTEGGRAGGSRWQWEFGDIEGAGGLQGELGVPGVWGYWGPGGVLGGPEAPEGTGRFQEHWTT